MPSLPLQPPPSTLSSPPPLTSLLNHQITITLKPPLNRLITGTLVCIDHQMNIILRQAVEVRWLRVGEVEKWAESESESESSNVEVDIEGFIPVKRELAQCLVLVEYIARIEIDKSVWDNKVCNGDDDISKRFQHKLGLSQVVLPDISELDCMFDEEKEE